MPHESPSTETVIVLSCETLPTAPNETEEESPCTIEFAYLAFDRAHNQILSSAEKIISPVNTTPKSTTTELQESSLTQNKSDARIGNLQAVLTELDGFLDGADPVYVVTFGATTLRHYIHSQASREKIKLHVQLYSYFDIGIEFQRNYPDYAEKCSDIQQIAEHLDIDSPSPNTTEPRGVELCRLILKVMQQLPHEGSRQTIQSQYSPIPSMTPLLEDTVVRTRGFSPSTTDVKLARFFSGLNIESGGIIMCTGSHGRPSNEALIRFIDKEQRDLALKRNGSKFGSRNLEITPVTSEEFSKVISQENNHCPNALEAFLILAAPPVAIIRVRGLPYATKAAEIVTFFGDESPVYRGSQGVFFIHHADRRPTGDAFVLFETAEHGQQALTKDREVIGKRYVELFQTTRNEVVQVFTRYSLPHNGIPSSYIRPIRLSDHVITSKNFQKNTKSIIRLRGLPYSASVQDILDFLNDFSKYVNTAGVHMVYNLQGRPSGDAFIEMRTAEHAQKAAETLHKEHIGERYIEVFQCSHSEMNYMLMHGIPNYRHTSWMNGASPYSPRTPPLVPTAFTYPPVSTTALSYPPVSPPTTVHSNSPHCSPMMSMPSSPTLSPPARVFVTSQSHGYVPYNSSPYNVFNYPTSANLPVEATGIAHAQSMMNSTNYESRVFFPGYQAVNGDYPPVGQMDTVFIPINPYLPPTNAYYQPTDTDTGHLPAYVETYSG